MLATFPMRELIAALSAAVIVAACQGRTSSSQTSSQPATASSPTSTTSTTAAGEAAVTSTESAVAPEVNPPGDIPDTQAFVVYKSAPGGYSLDVPEGWSRTENGANVSFVDKLDGVKVTVTPASSAATSTTARSSEAKQIQQTGRAVQITSVQDVKLPSGPAVRIQYTSNSDPNPVTNKQLRLENEAYLYFKNGKLVTLTLWAPKGADNVDQWQRMSKSFRWTG